MQLFRMTVRKVTKLESRRDVPRLISALQASDPDVRMMAAEVLRSAWTGAVDPRAVVPLCAALRDNHPEVRAAAAESLGHSRHPPRPPAHAGRVFRMVRQQREAEDAGDRRLG
jgi:HEAT repeat protein